VVTELVRADAGAGAGGSRWSDVLVAGLRCSQEDGGVVVLQWCARGGVLREKMETARCCRTGGELRDLVARMKKLRGTSFAEAWWCAMAAEAAAIVVREEEDGVAVRGGRKT